MEENYSSKTDSDLLQAKEHFISMASSDDQVMQIENLQETNVRKFTIECKKILGIFPNGACPKGWTQCPDGSCSPDGNCD